MAPLTMLLIDQKNSHSTYSCSSMQLYGNLCFLYTCICVNIVLELLTGIPLLIWRVCKYVGKINKLFVRILIEDRGWVLSKTTNRKTMHWNEKAKLMLCARDPFHFFFVGKIGPELPIFASDAPSFLAKRAPQRKNKHN